MNYLLLGISAFSIVTFLIVVNCIPYSVAYMYVHLFATVVLNIAGLYITSQSSNLKYYKLIAKDSPSIEYAQKLYVAKIIITAFVVVTMALSTLFGFSYYKIHNLNASQTKYKSDIESCNKQIENLKTELETNKEELVVNEIVTKSSKNYIEQLQNEVGMYEKVTGNTKGFVFITLTGSKFHLEDCYHLSSSSYFIMYTAAIKRGYTPCSNCLPNGY